MKEYLAEVFNPGGYLSRVLEGYAPRAGQIEYAQAVDRAITTGRHLLVEGPTGTGKSMAYSVPAIHYATQPHKRRVVIATSNIALQEQLMNKDLPMLAEALPTQFKYCMLKGKSNYLCLWKAGQYLDEQPNLFAGDRAQADAISTWSSMTTDGDKSNLPFNPEPKVWRQFSVTPDECLGSLHCGFSKECFSLRARHALESADLIVVNYSLLFSHYKICEATGYSAILPDFHFLIMDEGHEAAECARGFLGFKITEGQIASIARDVGGTSGVRLIELAAEFFVRLGRYYCGDRYDVRLRDPFAQNEYLDLYDMLMAAGDELRHMASVCSDPSDRAKLRSSARRAVEIATQIKQAMTDRDGEAAYYLEEMKGGGLAVRSKPLCVGPWLRERIFDNTPTVVVTSATLSTGGDFDYVAQEIGADHYDTLTVSSPFNWKRQAITVLPQMPDPRESGFPDHLGKRVVEAIKQAQGRTLALFTSYRNLTATYDRVMQEGFPYQVLKQGDQSRAQLLEEFSSDESSVLLATSSFWSGVDVPGQALSCLVVDKLPFPRPDDPVLDLLHETDRNAFMNHSVPRAIISLKQGVGRLIRTVDDYGAVVLLDCRLTTKGYGRSFIDSLPKTGITRKMSEIGRFFTHMQ